MDQQPYAPAPDRPEAPAAPMGDPPSDATGREDPPPLRS